MKTHGGIPNIKSDRRQLEKLIPSPSAMRTLDALARKLGTSREAIGAAVGVKGDIVLWAFSRGKMERAQEVRALVLAEVDKLIAEQSKANDPVVAR